MGVEMSLEDASRPGEELSVQARKRFASSSAPFALDADFSVPPGFTILFGASGAGKTTLLDCIAGLQDPVDGRIAIGNSLLFDAGANVNLPPNRRSVGYLMQSLALFPHMTVRQNVQYGLHGLPKAARETRSREILESFHIGQLAARRPAELSGGERQRAALARTLVMQPRALLLDEPLTALDARVKSQIVDDLRAWNEGHGIPILYVTHQREEIFAFGDRVIALNAGTIVAQGTPHEVMYRPELETVAQLVGFENVFECTFVADHPEQGTMTVRRVGTQVDLEVPLSRIDRSQTLRVGIRAGDILLASSAPAGLSARNVFRGTISSLRERDVMVIAHINCGGTFEAHITPAARESLQLHEGGEVWLVMKTYSCQVWQNSG
jgi:molybdate transport system ATP-binding protein